MRYLIRITATSIALISLYFCAAYFQYKFAMPLLIALIMMLFIYLWATNKKNFIFYSLASLITSFIAMFSFSFLILTSKSINLFFENFNWNNIFYCFCPFFSIYTISSFFKKELIEEYKLFSFFYCITLSFVLYLYFNP